ncbi:MAG: hypothetical protein M1358_11035 [Chloroflexi bacterium]|nr:hypothetical protein [Chloroflexota bacterium]
MTDEVVQKRCRFLADEDGVGLIASGIGNVGVTAVDVRSSGTKNYRVASLCCQLSDETPRD